VKGLELYFIEVDTGELAEVPLAEEDQELLGKQMTRCMEHGGAELFARWLAQAFSMALPTAVDYDLRPPSEAQIAFATAIARVLRLPLEPDVLRYRGSMHEFLSRNKDEFDARRKGLQKAPREVDGLSGDIE
jgi:hypothetical protein